MKWFKDGDQLVLVRDDFVSLRESDYIMFPYSSENAVIIRRMLPEDLGLDLTGKEIKIIKNIIKNNKNVQNIKIIKEINAENLLMTTTTISQLNKLRIEKTEEEVKIKKLF